MDYTAFDTEDFLLDPFFTEWAMDGRHDDFWQKFMAENPDREELVQQARLIILAAQALPVAPLNHKLRTEMWENVRQKMSEEPAPPHASGSGWRGAWRWVAAAVLLTAGLMGWQWSKPGHTTAAVTYEKLVAVAATNHSGLVEHVNPTAKILPVRLPDGSSVLLQSRSRISYSESDFGISKREVYISGEAFFEVSKNPEKPFFVYANELVTKVLGTSFTVRAYPDDKQVNVAVRTGKVSVFTQVATLKALNHGGAEPEATVLMPNQQVTLNREELKLSKTMVSHEMLPAHDSTPLSFKFEDERVSVIFEKLEKAYGIEIAYDKALLAGCKITASLNDEPLYEKISLICQGLGGATYEVIGSRIVVHSNGCN